MNAQEILYNPPTRRYELLMTNVHLFPLKIRGSRLEKLIREVLSELKTKKLKFKPRFYLSDEFGCVQETLNVGLPFYLADRKIEELNRRVGSERRNALDDDQIKAILRHECGHAFFYAYEIQKNRLAQRLFGDFSSKRIPFKNLNLASKDFADYLERRGAASRGYSRTHPEEDFADTFAAWLDPNEKKKAFRGKALRKLTFIKKEAHRHAGKRPKPLSRELHKPQAAIRETLARFFERHFGPFDLGAFEREAAGFLDHHLREVFLTSSSKRRGLFGGARFLERNKEGILRRARRLVQNPQVLRALIKKSIKRSRALKLVLPEKEADKAKKIFPAVLALMATLLAEKGRVN